MSIHETRTRVLHNVLRKRGYNPEFLTYGRSGYHLENYYDIHEEAGTIMEDMSGMSEEELDVYEVMEMM